MRQKKCFGRTPDQIKAVRPLKDGVIADFTATKLMLKNIVAKVIILNNKNIVLKIMNISLGSINFAYIEPREVLSEAVKMQAPKIILVHNHPSGDPKPSKADFKITDRIYECASIMGIELLDHVIIGDGTFESI